MPYTTTQFNSVQIKSSINSRSLVLNQVVQDRSIPVNSSKAKQRKLKGSKMKRSEPIKQQLRPNSTNVKLPLRTVRTSQRISSLTNRKKGIILEMEKEDSGSDTSPTILTSGEVGTWQDVQEENAQLKSQIVNQIAIFEQYLKVAILQQKQRQREADAESKQIGKRHKSAEDKIFKEGRDFEFDQKQKIMADELQSKI